jgi:hypothetical protein
MSAVDHEALMRGDMEAFQRALGHLSDRPEDSLDLGPDDRDDDASTVVNVCDICREEFVDGECACRCRSCGKPAKGGSCGCDLGIGQGQGEPD